MAVTNHAIYLLFSVTFTIVVGRSLFRHGRLFLIECFQGSERHADALNRLFLTGFYLLNTAFVCFMLRYGQTGTSLLTSLELIAGRVGTVSLLMGVMHFHNLYWCNRLRQRRLVAKAMGSSGV